MRQCTLESTVDFNLQDDFAGMSGLADFSNIGAANPNALARQEAARQRQAAARQSREQRQEQAAERRQTAQAARQQAAQQRRDDRIAKRLANGKIAKVTPKDAALHDKMVQTINAIKAKIPEARRRVQAAKTPADRQSARQFVTELLAQLGYELKGSMGVSGLSGFFGDEMTDANPVNSQNMNINIQPPPAPPRPKICDRRPQAPACMYYDLSQQSQQQMYFFMSIIIGIQQQLMDLINQLLAQQQNQQVAPAQQIDPNTGAPYGYQASAPGMGPSDIIDMGMQTTDMPTEGMTGGGGVGPAYDQFDNVSDGVPTGVSRDAVSDHGGIGPVPLDFGANTTDVMPFEDEGGFTAVRTKKPVEDEIIPESALTADSFVVEGENPEDEIGFNFDANAA